MSTVIQKDIVILGGGIAGLWLLNRLCNEGYDAILFEASALGHGQTIASQGMIHGGVKYALGGSLTKASNTIAEMPAYWKDCINGEGDIDLSNTALLSERYFMWPRTNLRSRMTAFLGSKALRGRVNDIPENNYPDFFKGHIKGPLYELTDIVLDVPSLLKNLSDKHRSRIFKAKLHAESASVNADGNIQSFSVIDNAGNTVAIKAKQFITTCGEGTEQLLNTMHLPSVPMQRRPLHMVIMKHDHPLPIYVHCVSEQLSSTPELTLTTHHCHDGKIAWYMGGQLAEAGIDLNQEQQIDNAKKLVESLFPWCDFSTANWQSFFINRAEPKQADGNRPDTAFIKSNNNLMVCWPTKLTLAPALANEVLSKLKQADIQPSATKNNSAIDLPFPEIAQPPWETCFQ